MIANVRSALVFVGFALVGCEPAASPRGPSAADDGTCQSVLTQPKSDHFGKGPDGSSALAIAPGEVLCVTATVEDGKLQDFSLVRPEHPAATTIRIEARVTDGNTLLIVKSPGPHTLRYHALMARPGRADLQPTSVCPLFAGLPVTEHWPHPIGALVLYGFEVAPSASKCE